jgi:hypothetical protein
MTRYIRQFFSLLDTVCKKIVQLILNRKLPQPDSFTRETYSFTEITRNPTNQQDPEQIETISIETTRNHDRQRSNNQRKSKRAKWAEDRRKQEIAYTEAKANGDKEGTRKYWKWIKQYGASAAGYHTRTRTKRKATKKIADRNSQITSTEVKKRKAERKADAQCELPENIMIEHLEDHRDGIGWSIAALAKKRFYVRRTLKSNDPNGDMFCEVDDNGESLLKAVKQLISEHDRFNKNK